MVNPRTRKKLKNPKLKISKKRKNPLKRATFAGHPLFKDEWDPKQTLARNYRKMGLVAKMNGVAGGIEKDIFAKPTADDKDSSLAAATQGDHISEEDLKKLIPEGYGVIERDSEGNIVKVIMPEEHQDPLDSDYEVDPVPAKTGAVKALEDLANNAEKRKRWMSVGERHAIQDLIDAHGHNYRAMFWDNKLNVNQYTERQLEKMVKRYLEEKERFERDL
ncbi:Nucleolar protein 16 [Spiromyces aspiralis]|uniref:Nucleolar protein 16 n=1 Tax=Spiromyces aspiralis TaxID=68401 RepID=A0ACC1HHM7_9FUNG|nr:Nucleolar protein 16 [Spiromyces aspiralis]